jgi:hypothetical protein
VEDEGNSKVVLTGAEDGGAADNRGVNAGELGQVAASSEARVTAPGSRWRAAQAA